VLIERRSLRSVAQRRERFGQNSRSNRTYCSLAASVSRRRWTGECELVDGRTVGLVYTSAPALRAEAHPSGVLVSNAVKDLAAGSGIKFENGGKSSSRASQAEDGSTVGQLNVRS
jgi:hypothetical protein